LILWFNKPNRPDFERFVAVLTQAIVDAKRGLPDPPVTAAPDDSLTGQIRHLKQLFDDGVLSREQFEAAKNKLVGNEPGPPNISLN
jgi:hypothetical protein